MNNLPQNAQAGDMFFDPVTEKAFYFTGEKWVDITRHQEKDFPKEGH